MTVIPVRVGTHGTVLKVPERGMEVLEIRGRVETIYTTELLISAWMLENEKRNNYQDLARELAKLWGMKVTVIPVVIGAHATVTKRCIKGLEGSEIGDTSGDHPKYNIVEIG